MPIQTDSYSSGASCRILDHHNLQWNHRFHGGVETYALAAVNRSYAPYSLCPSGVSLVDWDGKVYKGWYMESVAYNPSLGPVKTALVDYVIRVVLVEKEDAVVRQELTARLLLQMISPKCDFNVFHCHSFSFMST